jgi:hypothetical protein
MLRVNKKSDSLTVQKDKLRRQNISLPSLNFYNHAVILNKTISKIRNCAMNLSNVKQV